MPYYVYKILPTVSQIVKNLELVAEYENYKEAKNLAKTKRAEQPADDKATYKVIFADNSLQAEEQLMEHREAPILREWEK